MGGRGHSGRGFYLEAEALLLGHGPQDAGGDAGGQHVEAARGGGARVAPPPVEQHPPAQQGGHLVTGEHLPVRPNPAPTPRRVRLSPNRLDSLLAWLA